MRVQIQQSKFKYKSCKFKSFEVDTYRFYIGFLRQDYARITSLIWLNVHVVNSAESHFPVLTGLVKQNQTEWLLAQDLLSVFQEGYLRVAIN